VIKKDLVNLIKVILEEGKVGNGFNKSLIVLIPKSSDPKKVKDFRPISLLGEVYKIVVKILANRIRLLVPKLLHPNQFRFIHGRSLAKTCLSVWFGVEDNPKMVNYILLIVDFEKAYDRLEWRFIHACLKVMNFGTTLCNWVKGLLGNASAVVQINGDMIYDFPIARSVKQGCPLAPLLFALATEPLVRGFLQRPREGVVEGLKKGMWGSL